MAWRCEKPGPGAICAFRRVEILPAAERRVVKELADAWELKPTTETFIGLKHSLSKRLGVIWSIAQRASLIGVDSKDLPNWLTIEFLSSSRHAVEIFDDAINERSARWALLFDELDISSMTRQLILAAVFFIKTFSESKKRMATVHFVYSIADFGPIPKSFGPIIMNGPAIKELAGWSQNPKLPCAVIIGIGYEEDLALGIIEDLEAARVWAFRPKDHDSRYDQAIEKRNRGLFDEISKSNLVYYSVYDPYALFVKLEALLGLSKAECRLIIVPFGPKIFALASCLAALCHYPEVGLWRVSGGENQEPVERKASGIIPSLSVVFSP